MRCLDLSLMARAAFWRQKEGPGPADSLLAGPSRTGGRVLKVDMSAPSELQRRHLYFPGVPSKCGAAVREAEPRFQSSG